MLRMMAGAVLVVALLAGGVASAGPCQNTNLDDRHFVIKKGKHNGRPQSVVKWKLKRDFSRTLHFQVRFDASVRYATQDPQNQHDWNKIMGVTTYRIHKNSIRLGWRYNPKTDRVELGYYGYLGGARTMPMLTSVALGEWADVSLGMDNDSMFVEVNGVRHEETGDLKLPSVLPTSTWILATAYFGGDEKAPQTISVDVRGIVADEGCTR